MIVLFLSVLSLLSVTATALLSDVRQTPMYAHGRAGVACSNITIQGPVSPIERQALSNCTHVDGYVKISVSDHPRGKGPLMPRLEQIADYLMLFHVTGIKTLSELFPKLKSIRGISGTLQDNSYYLVLFGNQDLEQVDLASIYASPPHAFASKALIQNNWKLCAPLRRNWSVMSNYPFCDYEDNCSSSDDTCKDFDYAPSTSCDAECFGGCTASGACHSCLNLIHEGVCVRECPPDFLKFHDYRCVTHAQCSSLGGASYLSPASGRLCVMDCPPQHILDEGPEVATCVRSEGVCGSITLDWKADLTSPSYQLNCSKVKGSVTIDGVQFPGESLLRELFGEVREISGYLKVTNCPWLKSLDFLSKLQKIGGEQRYDKYSLYVADNINLEELREEPSHLLLQKGHYLFRGNEKLCPEEVMHLLNFSSSDYVSRHNRLNSVNVACNMSLIDVTKVVTSSRTMDIDWNGCFDGPNTRLLRGYIVHYRRRDIIDENTVQASDSQRLWEEEYVDLSDDGTFHNHSLTSLTPDTDYKIRISGDILNFMATVQDDLSFPGAMSDIVYCSTPPEAPSPPVYPRLSPSMNRLTLSWNTPESVGAKHLSGYEIILCPLDDVTHHFESSPDSRPSLSVAAAPRAMDTNGAKQCDAKWRREMKRMEEMESETLYEMIQVEIIRGGKPLPSEHTEGVNKTTVSSMPPRSTDSCPRLNKVKGRKSLYDPNDGNYCGQNGSVTLCYHKKDFSSVSQQCRDSLPRVTAFKPMLTRTDAGCYLSRVDGSKNSIPFSGLHYFKAYKASIRAFHHLTDCTEGSKTYQCAMTSDWSEVMNVTLPKDEVDLVTNLLVRPLSSDEENAPDTSPVIDMAADIPSAHLTTDCSQLVYEFFNGNNKHELAEEEEHLNVSQLVNGETNFLPISWGRENLTNESHEDLLVSWTGPKHPNGGIVLSFIVEVRFAGNEILKVAVPSNTSSIQLLNAPSHLSPLIAVTVCSPAGLGVPIKFMPLESTDLKTVLLSCLVMVFLFIFFVSIFQVYLRRKRSNNYSQKDMINHNYERVDVGKELIIDAECILILPHQLGEGQFANVSVAWILKPKEKNSSEDERQEGWDDAMTLLTQQGKSDIWQLKKKVAMKKLKDSEDQEQLVMEKRHFNEEAAIMHLLRESHFVVHFEGLLRTEPPCILMEMVEGMNLNEYFLENRNYITEQNILEFTIQIADGMAFIASKDIIHSDLTLKNCLIDTRNKMVKIADFGLAKKLNTNYYFEIGNSTPRGPSFIVNREAPPEAQKAPFRFCRRSDVWSFGLLLWKMLSPVDEEERGGHPNKLIPHEKQFPSVNLRRRVLCALRYTKRQLFMELLALCSRQYHRDRARFGHIVQMLLPHITQPFKDEFVKLSFHVSNSAADTVMNSQSGPSSNGVSVFKRQTLTKSTDNSTKQYSALKLANVQPHYLAMNSKPKVGYCPNGSSSEESHNSSGYLTMNPHTEESNEDEPEDEESTCTPLLEDSLLKIAAASSSLSLDALTYSASTCTTAITSPCDDTSLISGFSPLGE